MSSVEPLNPAAIEGCGDIQAMALGNAHAAAPRRRAAGARAAPLIIGGTDYLRVAAAVGIVWFHTPGAPGKMFAGTGTVVFVIMSFMFATQPAPLMKVVARRTTRILVPWAAWWAFYAAIALLTGSRPPGDPRSWTPWTFIAWPANHLWYLPFLFLNTLLLQALRPLFGGVPAGTKMVLAVLAGVAAMLILPHFYIVGLPQGAVEWVICLPLIGFGIAFGIALRADRSRRWVNFAWIIASIVLASCYIARQGPREWVLAPALGAVLIGLCSLPVRRSRFVTKLGMLTMGVYLIHPFVFLVVYYVTRGRAGPAPLMIAGVVLSALAAWVMRRTPVLRAIV